MQFECILKPIKLCFSNNKIIVSKILSLFHRLILQNEDFVKKKKNDDDGDNNKILTTVHKTRLQLLLSLINNCHNILLWT